MVSIKTEGLEKAISVIGNVGKQVRYATAVALTKTAKRVEKRLQQDMLDAFDNPTPWTARGTFTKPATKADLTAVVGIKDRQAVYIKEHFLGGLRGQKPFERVLTSMGLLPSGYKAIPGNGMKLDGRGNPSRAQLKEIIGSLGSRMQVAKGRGKKVQMVGYFAVTPGSKSHLTPGIYWRSGRALKCVLVFVKAAGYKKVMDLPGSAAEVVNKEFAAQFSAALDQAIGSMVVGGIRQSLRKVVRSIR